MSSPPTPPIGGGSPTSSAVAAASHPPLLDLLTTSSAPFRLPAVPLTMISCSQEANCCQSNRNTWPTTASGSQNLQEQQRPTRAFGWSDFPAEVFGAEHERVRDSDHQSDHQYQSLSWANDDSQTSFPSAASPLSIPSEPSFSADLPRTDNYFACSRSKRRLGSRKEEARTEQSTQRQSPRTRNNAVGKKKKRKNKTSRVRFSDTLQVRSLPVVLGLHPCCKEGMALTLGWPTTATDHKSSNDNNNSNNNNNCQTVEWNLNAYESASLKRGHGELHLDYFDRRQRLEDLTGLNSSQLLQEEYELMMLCRDEQEEHRQREQQRRLENLMMMPDKSQERQPFYDGDKGDDDLIKSSPPSSPSSVLYHPAPSLSPRKQHHLAAQHLPNLITTITRL